VHSVYSTEDNHASVNTPKRREEKRREEKRREEKRREEKRLIVRSAKLKPK